MCNNISFEPDRRSERISSAHILAIKDFRLGVPDTLCRLEATPLPFAAGNVNKATAPKCDTVGRNILESFCLHHEHRGSIRWSVKYHVLFVCLCVCILFVLPVFYSQYAGWLHTSQLTPNANLLIQYRSQLMETLTNWIRGARTRRFITAFTTARQRSLFWARWIHYTPPSQSP
jgi:hypothetical protein